MYGTNHQVGEARGGRGCVGRKIWKRKANQEDNAMQSTKPRGSFPRDSESKRERKENESEGRGATAPTKDGAGEG